MPHVPDDDDFARPFKVLRKRIDGVYREDHGFSGTTRRYVLMVVMLVGLASLPTLAILTTGSSEITGDGRTGAIDVPFLPPAGTGPVRPAPLPPAPGMPSGAVPSQTTQGYGESPQPSDPAISGPPLEPQPAGSRGGSPTPAPAASGGRRTGSVDRGRSSRDSAGSVPAPGGTARHSPGSSDSGPSRDGVGRSSSASDRRSSRKGGSLSRSGMPFARSAIPAVPDLPAVPVEDVLPEPVLPDDFPDVPDLPDIPDEPVQSADDDHFDPRNSHKPDSPGNSLCFPPERSSRRLSDRAATTQRPAGDPPRRDDRSTVHDRRSTDRLRHSRRSAVAERPYNIRPSRILEQNPSDGNLNVVRRLLTDSNSEENRRANRPYRGMHRAEHTNYPEERSASDDRSTRVGRHHADPGAHYMNRR